MALLRVYSANLTGSVSTVPKLRVYEASLTGAAGVALEPLADRLVDPESSQTITAVLSPGSATPDSYTWRRISGPAVTLSGTGASRTFTAPSAMPPGTAVTIGVTATLGAYTTPERTCVINVYPQTDWVRAAGSAGWVGAKLVQL